MRLFHGNFSLYDNNITQNFTVGDHKQDKKFKQQYKQSNFMILNKR